MAISKIPAGLDFPDNMRELRKARMHNDFLNFLRNSSSNTSGNTSNKVETRAGVVPSVPVKTCGLITFSGVQIGKEKMNMKDFCDAVCYVLTNTDLTSDDPRLELVEFVKQLKIVDGYNPGQRRLA